MASFPYGCNNAHDDDVFFLNRLSHTIMLKMFPWSICVSCMDGVFARNLLVVCLMQSSSAMRLIFWRFVYRCSVVVLSFIFCCCFCCISLLLHLLGGWISKKKKEKEKLMKPYCQFSVLLSGYFLMIIPGFFVFMNF